jgi:hypothetical protein
VSKEAMTNPEAAMKAKGVTNQACRWMALNIRLCAEGEGGRSSKTAAAMDEEYRVAWYKAAAGRFFGFSRSRHSSTK